MKLLRDTLLINPRGIISFGISKRFVIGSISFIINFKAPELLNIVIATIIASIFGKILKLIQI